MKRLLILLSAAVAVGTFSAVAAQDAQWTFDGTTITDGEWTFNATVKNVTEMTVGTPVSASCPTSVTPLDFSKPVKSSDGQTAYVITVLNCGIRNVASVRDCVGQLTLPGEGLVTIEGSCFGECKNLTGEIVFPTTLKRLKGAAFYKCTKLTCDAACIPSGVVEMGVQVFTSTGLYGDMSLPNLVTDDMRDTFLGTKITSVYLGPGVTGLWGANNQGPFQNCTELTNVVFDAGCSVYFRANSVFNGCTKLKELDLTCATAFDSSNIGHFNGCTSLKKITFGSKLTSLGTYTFNNASALEEVVFLGPPPKDFYLPYLQDQAGYTVLAKRNIKTTVYKSNYKTPNESGLSWLDYAANGEIRPVGSTFAADKVCVDPSLRPLVAPDLVIRGDTKIERVGDDWAVAVTVRSGEGELYVVATDVEQKAVTNLVSLTAAPSEDPYVCVLDSLEAGKAYSLTLLSRVDGLWESSAPFGSVFVGSITIERVADAEVATARSGVFKVALENGILAGADITVSYAVDPDSTAVAGTDYVALPGTIVIPVGANAAEIAVKPLVGMGATADTELTLVLQPNGYAVADPSRAALAIKQGVFEGWFFDAAAKTISDGTWTFAATLSGTEITVGAPTATGFPTVISPLDFSKPVVNTATGEPCTIVSLNGMFNANGTAAAMVGALTLPGESVTSIGGGAFRDCRNATGSIVLPSRLTALPGAMFFHCSNLKIDLNRMPKGITSVSPQVFGGCKGAFGDVDLPNVTAFDGRETFSGTAITSIRFGAAIGASSSQFFLGQGGGQGCFDGCTSLTNVVIAAPQTITLHNFSGASYQSAFNGCSALETLDVSGFPNWNSPFQFTSCGKLTRVILGGVEMNTLASDAFKNLSALSEVVFKGVPPNTFGIPYLGTAGQKVTTVISLANMKTPNTSGKCWTDYAQGGAINHRSSTFAADYVTPDINLSLRPLITEESGEMEVETEIAYDLTETVWKLSVLVKDGFGDLTAIVTDESGTETRKTFAKDATPSDTPYVCAFEGLEAGATLKIALFIDCQGLTERKELGSIFNGGVSIVKGADADGSKAQPGTFTVALDDGLTVASDLYVNYTINAASTALSGKSYVALPGVATIPAGANSGTITVIPLLDPDATGPVTLALDLAEGSYFISEPAAAEISILNGNMSAPWFFNTEASTVSDGLWSFACTADKQGVTIGTVIAGPAELSPLDFSKLVVDQSGTSYTIVGLNSYFNDTAVARVIGELTMPGEGLKTIGDRAFHGASNATGEIILPSTLERMVGFAFAGCSKLTIDAAKLPSGLNNIGACVFQGCKGMTGDVDLPSLEYMDGRSCFSGTGITSFRCGSPTLTGWNGVLSGGWNQGCFQNCTALTNVDFSAVQSGLVIDSGSAFAGCSSLKEIDLTGVTGINAFAVSGYFQGCTKLGKVTFGETFNSLHATTFRDCSTTISNIVFKGRLPDTFGISYLTNVTQKVTTTILRTNKKVQNTKGLCWLDLAKDGQIRHKGTTFAADYVTPEIDLALRPLVVLEPDGLMMIIK